MPKREFNLPGGADAAVGSITWSVFGRCQHATGQKVATLEYIRLAFPEALQLFKPTAKPLLIAFGDLQTYTVAGKMVLASKVFAGARGGVYQVFISQMSPSDVLTSVPAAAGTAWHSWSELALPLSHSLAGLRVARKL